jgi:DNA uptake protein ComE-like DNA-binding protein
VPDDPPITCRDAAADPAGAVDLAVVAIVGAPDRPPESPAAAAAGTETPPPSSPARSRGPFRRRLRAVAEAVSYTDRQRRAMVAVLAVVFAVLLWRVARDRSYVSDPQPVRPTRFDELADRLDPNTAPWEELVALPTLGEKRAKAIVEYRDEWRARHPGEPAFKALIDLAAVKGIGASTLETIGPHVMFPPSATPALRTTPAPAKR